MKASCLRFLGGLVAVAALAAAAGLSPRLEDLPKPGGLLRLRDFAAPAKPSLDPASGTWVFATEQIFEGLIRLDNRLELVPSLAEYWMISEDGRRTTFILKRGVRFHHGRDLDAYDVKFSLERLLRKETQSPYAGLLAAKVVGSEDFREGRTAEVAGFRVPEKYVFEVTWKTPSVASLYLLGMSFCKILPRDRVTEEGASFFDKPSGTGAFRFGYWLRSPRLDIVGVHLENFHSYHGRKAYLAEIDYSPHFTVDHFMAGEVDVMPFFSERMANSGCQTVACGANAATYLLFGCQVPPFDRVAVRRAVAAAFDKDRLAEAVKSSERVREATASVIPAGLPGFLPADEGAAFDPEQARRLLDELGYSDERRFPGVTLFIFGPRNDLLARLGRAIASQLEAARIPTDVRFVRAAEELRDIRTPYLVLYTWTMEYPDPESLVLPLFGPVSPGRLILHRYANPSLDRMIEEATAEKGWSRRIDLFKDIEKLLRAEAPVLPLFAVSTRLAVQSAVRGLRPPPLGPSYLDAKDLWLDRKGSRP